QAGAGRLYLLAHHLAIDGVSWRILLDEIPQIASAGGAAALARATPFRTWARHLSEHAPSGVLRAQLPFWEGQLQRGAALLPGAVASPARDTFGQTRQLRFTLPVAVTRALLTDVCAAFHAQVNDVLLTALAVAAVSWGRARSAAPGNSVLVDLEAHGREP